MKNQPFKFGYQYDPTGKLSSEQVAQFNRRIEWFCQDLKELHEESGYTVFELIEWLLEEAINDFVFETSSESIPPAEIADSIKKLAVSDLSNLYHMAPPFADVLGEIYRYLVATGCRKNWGIISMSPMVARQVAIDHLDLHQLLKFAKQKRQWNICSDLRGCSTGAVLLATAAEIYRFDPKLLKYVGFKAIDTNYQCCRMTLLNFLWHDQIYHQLDHVEVFHGNGLGADKEWLSSLEWSLRE